MVTMQRVFLEVTMFDATFAVLIAVLILTGLFLWVPLLDKVCPPCVRFLRSRRRAMLERTNATAARKMRVV